MQDPSDVSRIVGLNELGVVVSMLVSALTAFFFGWVVTGKSCASQIEKLEKRIVDMEVKHEKEVDDLNRKIDNLTQLAFRFAGHAQAATDILGKQL